MVVVVVVVNFLMCSGSNVDRAMENPLQSTCFVVQMPAKQMMSTSVSLSDGDLDLVLFLVDDAFLLSL